MKKIVSVVSVLRPLIVSTPNLACIQVLNQRYSDKLYKEALDSSLEDINKLST